MSLKFLTEENVGGLDRAARALIGSVGITVLALGLVSQPWDIVVAIIAATGLYTSIISHCTPYSLIGFSTKK